VEDADADERHQGTVGGEHSRDNDLDVNWVREKKLSNIRASGSDDAVRLVPYNQLTLEQCIEFIAGDELVEESLDRSRPQFHSPK
jgi:GTP-binding protein